MRDLMQFFSYMNDVNFPYVVLRNWERLPYSVELGSHSDLDLLVYDLDHWKELFPDAKQVFPAPRVQFRLPVEGNYVQIDVRYVTDNYYPLPFELSLLMRREKHPNGFYVPSVSDHAIALAYHCVHHKNSVNSDYRMYLGDATLPQLMDALKQSRVGWIEPKDPTVGRFNQYFKGATSVVGKKGDVVTKKQVSYMDYDLTGNEAKILRKSNSPHFPKLVETDGNELSMEDCGEPLTVDNLPDNWQTQLIEIVGDLRLNKIQHRDIKPDNLMVKGGVIKLIDFGWARFESDPPDNPPSVLGMPYKPSHGFDDNFSMMKVLKEFVFNKEDSGASKSDVK